MPPLTVLIYWLVFPILFPYQSITFRGQMFPANRADSLARVVQAEVEYIMVEMDKAECVSRSLDTIMAGAGDERYWREKREREAGRMAWKDSILQVKERELEGLR